MITIAGGILLALAVILVAPFIIGLALGALFWIACLALSPFAVVALPILALRDAWRARRNP